MNKEGSFRGIFIVMLASLVIAFFWDAMPMIKDTVHLVFDPIIIPLLTWNLLYGMVILIIIISSITSLVQKYATDQETLKQIKKDQKTLQKEMQKYKNDPKKMIDFQKKQMEFMPKMMKLSMRPIIFTGIPFVLFFRWFMDYFNSIGNSDILLGMGWFGTYFVLTIIFSMVLKKVLKVA